MDDARTTRTDPTSSGGRRLRAIREEAGRTQLWVELEAGLGTGYLQRVESGRVMQPARDTLGRILQALEATYNEWQTVMRLFGYLTPTDVPDARERRWARDLATPQLESFPFPAYALDCLHCLVAVNSAASELLGITSDDAESADDRQPSILEQWFDEESHLGSMVVEPDRFLLALVTAFRYEAKRFREEQWAREVVRQMRAIPRFERYWQMTETQSPPLGASRALIPLRLRSLDGQALSFRLSSEPFIDDTRFRVVYYFPDDLETMHVFVAGA
ncbi:hypothetical protein BH23CHL2_BH23CHL2_28080 [soil metagenome]